MVFGAGGVFLDGVAEDRFEGFIGFDFSFQFLHYGRFDTQNLSVLRFEPLKFGLAGGIPTPRSLSE